MRLVLGSEGAFGVITDVTVRVHRVPAVTRYQAWSFPDFAGGAAGLRSLAQTGALPTVLRISDEVETGMNLALAGDVGGTSAAPGGCLAVTTVEGTVDHAGRPARRGDRAAHRGGRHPARRGAGARLGAGSLRRAVPA